MNALNMNNGETIPGVGFGLWRNRNEAACKQAVHWALAAGYRHFDTAQIYGNEQHLGAALQEAQQTREDVFITTKIHLKNFGYRKTLLSTDLSLRKLQTDYIDLLLLHFPVPVLRDGSWRALEELHLAGKARAIGVSNYTIRHLEQLLRTCKVKPAVNQVELHVFLQQPELLEYCRANDIVVEAYSPLAHGRGLDNPVLKQLADKYHKSSGQIMLRWCIEQGTVPLPKSTHQNRIEENINIFDFSFDDNDKQLLKSLNKNMRTCWHATYIP